jgi:hypothetical protein
MAIFRRGEIRRKEASAEKQAMRPVLISDRR